MKVGTFTTLLSALLAVSTQSPAISQTAPLPAPAFHHLHLNSVDPEAAVAFYTRQFATTSKSSWNGLPALKSPTNVLILFNMVATPPATSPQMGSANEMCATTPPPKKVSTRCRVRSKN